MLQAAKTISLEEVKEIQQKIIAKANELEAAKETYKVLRAELDALLVQVPMNSLFQDPTTKLVYKVVVPKGTFIEYKTIDYVRTKKADEDKGSLSMKEAEAAGFTVK